MATNSSINVGLPLDLTIADIGLRRARDRSVLSVQPPTDEVDGFVKKALDDVERAADAAPDGKAKDKVKTVTALLTKLGLTEAVAKATTKLNLGGLDRTQRLLLSRPAVYADILRSALVDSTGKELAADQRLVDFKDTEGLVDFVVRRLSDPRELDAAGAVTNEGGYRTRYSAALVSEVIAGRALDVKVPLKNRTIEDVGTRELPTSASKVDELIGRVLDARRATTPAVSALDLYIDSGDIDKTRFTDSVKREMISYLRRLGVNVDAITSANRKDFDEYFALAYNQAIRSADGATADPIDAVRQKGAITDWNFEVDTFDTVEEQGVVPQNILAAGALDYVYNLGERLGIFRLADALVVRWASGAFDAEPGAASADLYRYWKLRQERISPEERAMIYKRILAKGDGNLLSGMVENEEFPALWGQLMEKATDYIRRQEEATTDRTVSKQPIYQATKQLQYNLTEHATGMAHMQITEMYHHLIEAKGVLEHAIDYFSTGSRKSLWTVIERASREWFDEAPNIAAIRSAAIDGNKVFRWIAEFDQSGVTDDQFQGFLESAEAWILAQASDDSEPVTGEKSDEDEDKEDEDKDVDSDWDK